MIKPFLQDEQLLESIQMAREVPGQLHLWWLGQSGFLLQWHGHHLLLDPYLSDSLTKKYADTDKPHVRMTERVIDPIQLDFIDVVTSSHNHTDHLDAETLGPLLQKNRNLELVIPEANRAFVADRLKWMDEMPRGLNAGESISLAGFKIHAVPAAHETLETDLQGRHKYLGYVIQAGPYTVYHSGDTVRHELIMADLKRWSIDLALMPINGRGHERKVAANLNGQEAALMAHDLRARMVIPCHYEMFEFNTASPDEFVQTCRHLNQKYRVLRAGEHWSTAEL